MNQKADQEIENTDDDTIVLEGEDTQQPQAQAEGEQDQATEDEGDNDDVIVSIGEEAPPPEEQPAHAPEWVRELRKTNRELQRQNRELQSKLQTTSTETKPVVLGTKPKLEDFDYDADQFETALANWFERKRQADEANAKQEAEVMTQQKAWQAKLEGYGKAKTELRVPDYEDAEAVAQTTLTVPQQSIIVAGAENPALLIYALGRNEAKAKELAAITDPVKFTFAIAKLEAQLKVTPRKAPPAPEKPIRSTGGVSVSGAVDGTLERLREDAARTNDSTKVLAYLTQKRNAAKK